MLNTTPPAKPKEISAISARQRFGELLDQAYYQNNSFVVKRMNKPMAVMISVQKYNQLAKQKKADFKVLKKIWSKIPKLSAKEAQKDIAQAIGEVRGY